jgi:urocanate hydratase
MQDIEIALRAALRRQDAPAGLAGRIIAQAEGRGGWGRAQWLAVAAAVLVMVAVGWQYQLERNRRLQAENNAQQLEQALRIVADRLSKVERQVRAPETRVIHLQADQQQENLQ